MTNINSINNSMTPNSYNGALIQITYHRWTAKKQSKSEEGLLTAEADRKWVRATKTLIDPTLLRSINSTLTSCKTDVKRYTLPFPLTNVTFVPTAYKEKVEIIIADYQEQLKADIESLLNGGYINKQYYSGYSEQIDKAQIALGSAFNRKDYPSEYEIKSKFSIRTTPWFDLTTAKGESENTLSPLVEQFKAETTALLREEFTRLVEHVVNRCVEEEITNAGNNRKKPIHKSSFEHLYRFLETAPHLNISNDEDLNDLITQTKNLMDSSYLNPVHLDHKIKDVRNSSYVRKRIVDSFNKLLAGFDAVDEIMSEESPQPSIGGRLINIPPPPVS